MSQSSEPVWSFRGYDLHPHEFTSSMVHFYRGEIQRANTWRTRLDATTNWAIITTWAAITFSLSDPTRNHGILLINLALVLIFLLIEARRYRYFELFSYRVRLLETDFFAAMLVPPFQPSPDWAETLATSLLRPRFPISTQEAIGRRLRNNYLALILVLISVWFFQVYTLPIPAVSIGQLVTRATVSPVPGEWVVGALLLFTLGVLAFAASTIALQEATGEVLEQPRVFQRLRTNRFARPSANDRNSGTGKWQRPSARREEYMTMIITDKGNAVAEKLMQDLKRGVTALHGEGMYTQKPREILICALTQTEIQSLKDAVRSIDPHGFVVVMPASEIAGWGFQSLGA